MQQPFIFSPGQFFKMETEKVNPRERVELVEVIISNTGVSQFVIGSNPNLRDASRIIKVEALPVTAVTFAPSGRAVVNAAVFNKSYLRLIDSNNIEYRQMALPSISKQVNGTTIPVLNTPRIDPEKSMIQVASTAGLVLNESFLLQVTYEK